MTGMVSLGVVMVDRRRIQGIVLETLKDHLPAKGVAVDVDVDLGPLGQGMNSVNHLELLIALETRFEVCIQDDCWDSKSLNTVTKIVDYFCNALNQ